MQPSKKHNRRNRHNRRNGHNRHNKRSEHSMHNRHNGHNSHNRSNKRHRHNRRNGRNTPSRHNGYNNAPGHQADAASSTRAKPVSHSLNMQTKDRYACCTWLHFLPQGAGGPTHLSSCRMTVMLPVCVTSATIVARALSRSCSACTSCGTLTMLPGQYSDRSLLRRLMSHLRGRRCGEVRWQQAEISPLEGSEGHVAHQTHHIT